MQRLAAQQQQPQPGGFPADLMQLQRQGYIPMAPVMLAAVNASGCVSGQGSTNNSAGHGAGPRPSMLASGIGEAVVALGHGTPQQQQQQGMVAQLQPCLSAWQHVGVPALQQAPLRMPWQQQPQPGGFPADLMQLQLLLYRLGQGHIPTAPVMLAAVNASGCVSGQGSTNNSAGHGAGPQPSMLASGIGEAAVALGHGTPQQ